MIFAALLAGVSAAAQQGTVHVTAFPPMGVADGNGLVTLTAEVRDGSGRLARDGTQVVFETDRGIFRSRNSVATQNGLARIQLVAPGQPGTARVRVSAFSIQAFGGTEVEFVSDRALLDQAQDYVEVSAPNGVVYSPQKRIMEATGDEQGAVLRYRDIEIRADSLQLSVSSYEVRAKGAEIKLAKHTARFRELYIRLNQWKGTGLVVEDRETWVLRTVGPIVGVTRETRPQIVAYELGRSGFKPAESSADVSRMSFTAMNEEVSTVEGRKAVVYPARQIQFHKAAIRMGGQTVMSLPLFELSTATSSPIVTEQFLNVSNNNVAVNYPHYLSLKPGQTTLMRFRYGSRISTGAGAAGGTFLDFEHRWDRGSAMQGAFTVQGLTRSDWGASLQQYWQAGPATSISAQIDTPAHSTLFANASINHRLPSATLSYSAQIGRSLDGGGLRTDQQTVSANSDPLPIGRTPLTVSFGANAADRRIAGSSSLSQRTLGLETRLDMRPISIGSGANLSASYTLGRLFGDGVRRNMTQVGTLSLGVGVGEGYIQSTYEFVADGFSDDFLGQHRLTTEMGMRSGALSVSGFLAQSLDKDRFNVSGRADYRFSRLWRVSYATFWDRFEGDTFLDQTLILGYKLGFREIGLSYSSRTRRIGFELLGTSFD